MMYSEKLASISEYGDSSTTTTSLAGLSSYSDYLRSPSGESLNTLATTSRNFRNGLPGEKTNSTGDALSQRIHANGLMHKHNYELCKKVRITMALIGILLLVAAIFMLSFYLPQQYNKKEDIILAPLTQERLIWNNYTEFETEKYILSFSMNFSKAVLESEIGPKISMKIHLGQFLSDYERDNVNRTFGNNTVTMRFRKLGSKDETTFELSKRSFSDSCFDLHWETHHTNKLEDCFDTQSTHWYGLGEVFDQQWPLSKVTFPSTPFLTSDFLDKYTAFIFGGALEPFAVNSKGGGIYVNEIVPLHISMNSQTGRFCIRADKKDYNKKYKASDTISLAYTVCVAENIREVHKMIYNQFIDKPSGIPDKEMMLTPIWSTWARYKKEVNQSKVLQFSKEIRDYGFGGSILEIDDKYSKVYGDYEFSLDKFSKIVQMLQILHSRKFRVTVWVCPFSNLKSKSFQEGVRGYKIGDVDVSYFVKTGPKSVPGITKWWNGLAGIIDTTDEKSLEWFRKKLGEFQFLPIDGFKFDAGETNYLPFMYNFSVPQANPNYFSKHYVKLASKYKLAEVRVAYKSQKYPVLVRILDRASLWGTKNGLRSVLTATLTLGILGYPFVLPDMVGGNGYVGKPSRELYIRWAQLTAFLPAIQFSLPPWDYGDKETIAIVQNALEIRKNFSEVIYSLASSAQDTGEPIIRPLWWYWPTDHETFVIDTEFMLGESYLIAPILHINVITHAVYLPAGVWEEQWNQHMIVNMTEGGLKYYNVTINDICFFKLIQKLPSKR